MSSFFRLSLFSGLMVFLSSSNKQATPNITGLWSEHWMDSDVDYVDTLCFTQKNDSLFISLLNRQENWEPNYVKVNFDGSILTYRMDANKISNFYVFQLSEDQKKLEGKVQTWKGNIRKIHLIKQEE